MPPTGKPDDKRLQKGRQTRERLLEEALRLFAARGYDGVGIRDVAAAAKTNVAAIAFHFSGKEGLYAAVIEHVAGDLARLHRQAAAEAGRESDALGETGNTRIVRIVSALVTALLSSNRPRWTSLLLQREFITPTRQYQRLYDQAVRPILETLAARLHQANARSATEQDCKILAFSLFILASSFLRNKNTLLTFLEKQTYTQDDTAAIARIAANFAAKGLAGLRAVQPD